VICFETALGPLEIRELSSIADMLAAEQIQLRVWGADIFPHPKEMLIPAQHEGGLLAGAFTSSGEMVGLIFHFPTRDPQVVHSQMLAVLETWRGQGLGRRLKVFQRDWCLEHGIAHVRWTVDPLRAANAELNIRRLGGVCSTYLPDYYGPMQGIDAGAPTDRILVEWDLNSERAQQRTAQNLTDTGFPEVETVLGVENGCPVYHQPMKRHPAHNSSPRLMRLPADFINLSKVNSSLALEWRKLTRELLLDAFDQGYEIHDFTRVGGPAYLLKKRVL
jgi:chorismate synthase